MKIMIQFILILGAAGVHGNDRNFESSKTVDELVITVEEFNTNSNAYTKSLTEDGVWVTWNTLETNGFPQYSIYGGYDDQFNPSFVARMTHTIANNTFKVNGKFLPMIKMGYYEFNGHVYSDINVEVLIHKNHIWTKKEDRRLLIRGGSGGICRIKIDGLYWIPGSLDEVNDICTVVYNKKILKSTAFQTLRRACVNNEYYD